MKRYCDLVLCFVIAPPLLVIIAILAIIIVSVDGFSPFHPQRRMGRKGMLFTCYKLQTMIPASDPAQIGEVERDVERLTKLGMFLRNHGWDELPQIINVIKGDMSFVGPRPLLPKTIARIRERNSHLPDRVAEWERTRTKHRPDISGWHQIHLLGESSIFEYDLEYLSRGSRREKVGIMIITIAVFLIGKNTCAKMGLSYCPRSS